MNRMLLIAAVTAALSIHATTQIRKSVEIDNKLVKLSFDKSTLTWSLFQSVDGEWATVIQNASMGLTLRGTEGAIVEPEGTDITAKEEKYADVLGEGRVLNITIRGTRAVWGLSFVMYDGKSILSLQTSIANRTRETWKTNELSMFRTDNAAHVQLAAEPLLMHVNGYQSWSRSDVVRIDSTKGATSYWSALLYEPEAYRSILFGYITNVFSTNRFEVEPLKAHDGQLHCSSVSDIRTFELPAGKEMRSDRLLISIDSSPHDNLVHYGEDLELCAPQINKPFTPAGKQNTATLDKREVPAGWCSWYYYYERIGEDSILQNLNFAAKHLQRAGVKYIQIDDGYQAAAGEWDVNNKFPNGHKWLVEQIHAKKMLAGLWVAPFAVAEKSKLFAEHPDWLLRTADDSLKVFFINESWGGKIYGLDPSIHEVQAWLENLFYKIESYWGYDYVKIDFLHFANDGGKYSKPVTSTQAYQLGLAAIRRGVGSDKFILGCGAPIGSSVGYVDGMRIGNDIYAGWDGITPGVDAAARRYFLHNTVWYDDPDCLVVRDPLTLDQARVWASVVALSGQMNLLSDKLSALPPERLALLKMTLPSFGKPATPVDLFAEPPPGGIQLVASAQLTMQLPGEWKFSTGDDSARKNEEFDDSKWKEISVPSHWEDEGYPSYDGFVWYRIKFQVPAEWPHAPLKLALGKIDDCDEAFVNGVRIGGTGTFPPAYESEWTAFRKYTIPENAIHWGSDNTLAVRVYDGGGPGGIYSVSEPRLPSVWKLAVEKPFEKWNVAGLYNWSDENVKITCSANDLNLLAKKSYLLYELWSGRYLGELNRQISLNLPPTSSAILTIHEKKNYPLILSTSRHITQGSIDLADETWDEAKRTLTILCDNLLDGEYDAVIYAPEGFSAPRVVAPCKSGVDEIAKNVYRVKLFPYGSPKLTWKAVF